jgi:hypothetical protein
MIMMSFAHTLRSAVSVVLLVIVSALLPAVADRAQAQPPAAASHPAAASTSASFLGFTDITIGPMFTAGVSRMNEQIPEGWHSAPRFAYTFGGLGYLSFNDWVGFNLGMYYDTRDLYLAMPEDTTSIDMGLDYLSIQPSIRIYWLMVGLAFDIPMAGSATEKLAHFAHLGLNDPYEQNRNIETSDMQPITELRASLTIPLVKVESGTVRILLSGNYPLTKTTIAGTTSFDSTGYFGKVGQGPLPTVQAGLTFQFDLLH